METQSKLELIRNFYECLKVEIDDMPKKNDNDNRKWSLPLNQRCDRIGIYVGNSEKIWIYIRSGHEGKSPTRTKRMVKYSDEIRSRLNDQQPFRDKGLRAMAEALEFKVAGSSRSRTNGQ